MHRYSGRPSSAKVTSRAFLAGISAGLRSVTPLGVMAAERNSASFRASWRNWPLLRSGGGRALLRVGWLGELVTDKLPVVPPRTTPEVLASRMVIGGLAGLGIATEGVGGTPRATALMAGTIGAVAGAYGGYAYRTQVAKLTGLPDLPLALIEDVVAYLLARKGITG